MQLLQVASNRPKSGQNPSPDPSPGPSDAVFHPGSVFRGPGARNRPPHAENDENRGRTKSERVFVNSFRVPYHGAPPRPGRWQHAPPGARRGQPRKATAERPWGTQPTNATYRFSRSLRHIFGAPGSGFVDKVHVSLSAACEIRSGARRLEIVEPSDVWG